MRKLRKVDCFICMDKGYVFVRAGLYEKYCHCQCVAGNDHKYDERPEGGHWFVPSITSVLAKADVEAIGVKNAREYARWVNRAVAPRPELIPQMAGMPPERDVAGDES